MSSSAYELLALVSSPERYRDFKRWLDAARIVNVSDTGPRYAGMPTRTAPIDRYDPNRAILSSNSDYYYLYCRFMHACLSGQYPLGRNNTIPRLWSPRLLDRHSVDAFFAPFEPRLNATGPVHTLTSIARWDRNTARLYPANERPVPARTESVQRLPLHELTPLYRDYVGEGGGANGRVNQVGIELNEHSRLLLRYVSALLSHAVSYRQKVRDAAEAVIAGNALRDRRQKLVNRLAAIQREKDEETMRWASDANLSETQRAVLARFNEAFEQLAK